MTPIYGIPDETYFPKSRILWGQIDPQKKSFNFMKRSKIQTVYFFKTLK